MRRELLALGMTVSILLSLLAFTQPTSAVLTTVSGTDEVTKPDTMEFETTVEIREDERIPIESFDLVLTTEDGETVTVTFTPDGTIQSIDPADGFVGEDDAINVTELERTIEITRADRNAGYGYGYRSGTDERTNEERSFGYGYGYGYGDGPQPSFGFDIQLDSAAFAPGEYTLHVSLNTDGDDTFASNEKTFDVLSGEQDATVDVDPDTLNKASNGKWVTAYIELPNRNVTDINISTVELEGVPAVDDPKYGFVKDPEIKDRDGDGRDELMVKFPRDEVAERLETGDEVPVTVTGTVDDSTFSATDTIRVIDRGDGPASASSAPDDDRNNARSNGNHNRQGNPNNDHPNA